MVLRPLAVALGLVVISILAGCVGDSAPEPDTVFPSPSRTPLATFAPSVRLHESGFAAEPIIVTSADGSTLFATAPAGRVQSPNQGELAIWVWRSRDHGVTWSIVREPKSGAGPVFACSCDADLVVLETGRVVAADFWVAPGAANFVVQSSRDDGDTWGPPAPLTMPANTVDRQWLLAGKGDTVYLFASMLSVPFTTVNAGTWMARSDDGGLTWSGFTRAVPQRAYFPLSGHPAALRDGTMIVPFVDQVQDFAPGPGVDFSLSKDGGASWAVANAAAEPEGIAGIFPASVGVDAADRIAIAWNGRSGVNGSVIRATFSMDKTAMWTPPVVVSNATGHHVLPWVAALPDGRFVVAYYATDATGPVLQLPASAEWHAWVSIIDPTSPESFDVVRVSDAPVHKGALCVFTNCGERHLRDVLGVTADQDGRVHVAYTVRSDDGELRVHAASTRAPVAPAS